MKVTPSHLWDDKEVEHLGFGNCDEKLTPYRTFSVVIDRDQVVHLIRSEAWYEGSTPLMIPDYRVVEFEPTHYYEDEDVKHLLDGEGVVLFTTSDGVIHIVSEDDWSENSVLISRSDPWGDLMDVAIAVSACAAVAALAAFAYIFATHL